MPTKRKIVIAISILLIIFDIGLTVTMYDAGERQLAATLEAVATRIGDYLNPIPRLGG